MLTFDLDRRRLTITISGPLGGSDALAAMRAYGLHPDRARVSDVVWDLRGVTGLAVTPDEVREILVVQRENERYLGPGRVAVVTANWWVKTIVALLGRLSTSRIRLIRSFAAMEEAEAWLDRARNADAAA